MNIFFNNLNRINALVYGVTIVVLSFPVLLSWFNRGHEEFQNVFGVIISDPTAVVVYENRYSIVGGILGLIVLWMLITRLTNRRRWRRITMLQERAWHDYIRFNAKLYQDLYDFDANNCTPDTLENATFRNFIGEKSEIFLEQSLTTLSRIASLYTGNHCHAHIKVFADEDNLYTIARDRLSIHDRSVPDEESVNQHYEQNTPFECIITNSRVDRWASNWLHLKSRLKLYKNTRNTRWKTYYNAAAVVPITEARAPAAIRNGSVYGFLCVDNHGGGFDEGPCAEILYGFARMYCSIIFLLQHKLPFDNAHA